MDRAIWLCLLLTACAHTAAPTVAASQKTQCHCSVFIDVSDVDRAFLEKPTKLQPGLGTLGFTVETPSAEARAFFSQGLALLHSYSWLEAARSFHQSLRSDPKLALAWWGLARAELSMRQRAHAKAALDQAKALAPSASARDRRYIELLSQQLEAIFTEGDSAKDKHQAYKLALESALADDPSDAEMWVLRGNAEEPTAAGRGQGGGMGAVAFYEAALARDPKHFGAHHYLVHSLENSGRALDSVEHARIYAALVPNVPHAQHMLGHVLPRLGKWDEAIAQFEKADHLEDDYATRELPRAGDDWHHTHNLDLLGYLYLRQGRRGEAEAAFRRQWATPIRDPVGEGFHSTLIELLLYEGRAAEALPLAQAMVKDSHAAGAVVGNALAAEALVQLGRSDEARRAAAAAQAALATSSLKPHDAKQLTEYFGDFVKTSIAEIDLAAPGAEQALTTIADAFLEDPSIDSWGIGLFVITRMSRAAARAGHTALAASLAARVQKIETHYLPPGDHLKP